MSPYPTHPAAARGHHNGFIRNSARMDQKFSCACVQAIEAGLAAVTAHFQPAPAGEVGR